MSKNITLIHNKENDTHLEEIKKEAGKIYETTSQAIYRISPILVKEDTNIHFPIISSDNTNIHRIKSIHKDNFIEKFALNEDQKTDNEYKTIDITTNQGEEDNYIELRLQEDEDEPRKYYDKYNLTQAFYFSCDPLSNKSEFIDEDEQCEIKFESMEDKLSRIFNISV